MTPRERHLLREVVREFLYERMFTQVTSHDNTEDSMRALNSLTRRIVQYLDTVLPPEEQ